MILDSRKGCSAKYKACNEKMGQIGRMKKQLETYGGLNHNSDHGFIGKCNHYFNIIVVINFSIIIVINLLNG